MQFMTVSELMQAAQQLAIPLFLSFVGMVVLMADLVFDREDERRWPAYLTIAGLLGSLLLWVQSWYAYFPPAAGSRAASLLSTLRLLPAPIPPSERSAAFQGMYDGFGAFGHVPAMVLLVLLVALIVTMLAPHYLEGRGLQRGEYYALLLFATAGLVLMMGANHLILLFLAIELLSIPLYILAGFARPELRSQEAALKYFLLGAFASGFLLYGIALLYGATGTMLMSGAGGLREGVRATFETASGAPNLMTLAGLTLLLVGLGFKISIAPFHQWTPDVYEGSPTPVTAFMVAGTKVGGFIALLNVVVAFEALYGFVAPLLAILALLTMVVGNIGALQQTNIKRMLAYSSIAHAGYMLVLLAGLTAIQISSPALQLYLAVYAMMNLGVFAVLLALEQSSGREVIELRDFNGLGREHPVLGLLLGFFLLSLAGFPPTAGFFSKLYLFTGAVAGGQRWLVAVAVVLSVLSFFYYARFIVAMFMQPADEPTEAEAEVEAGRARVAPSFMVGAAVAVTLLLVLGIGLFPNPALSLFERALTQ